MNILIVAPHAGGIEAVARNVGEQWENSGYNVEYRVPEEPPSELFGTSLGIFGLAVWWRKQFKMIYQNHREYDLIWIHQPVSILPEYQDDEFWDKTVITIHTTEHARYRLAKTGMYSQKRLPYYAATKLLERVAYTHMSQIESKGPHLTVISSKLFDELSWLDKHNFSVIPNGVQTAERDPQADVIRKEHGISDNDTVVFSIGALSEQKRPVLLTQIMHQITKKTDDVHFVIAGDGPLYEDVSEYACNSVSVLGYISEEEKHRWLSTSDVFVSLSAYEGMPVASLEAISYQIPVLLSDIPAHRVMFDEYGVTGELINNPSETLYKKIREKSRQKASSEFPTWEEISKRYTKIIG